MRLIFFMGLFFAFVQANSQQLVLPGDHPDPSVVKIGDEFWAVGTTSNWFPAFPLYRSWNLVNWEPAGHVFTSKPAWVDYYMWAPEITYENGKVYMYYTARRKEGGLCIAVAVAENPAGPYRDMGPLMCEQYGSIDAFPMRDEKGKLFMIWKEDGNSAGKPTPIWAAEMKEDRTAIIGERKELFRADATWERNLVEGVSIIRNNGYFYALYAAAGCCGKACSYATGVARSKNLLGPWEKYAGNPILTATEDWKCPGHGTAVEKDGKFYFLYHGYHTVSGAYAGRQGLLNEFEFTADGWLRFLNKKHYGPEVKAENITDNFSSSRLGSNWHWSIFSTPQYSLAEGMLKLQAAPSLSGVYLGQAVLTPDYEAAVSIGKNSTSNAGLGLIGDDNNTVTAFFDGSKIRLVQLFKGRDTVLAEKTVAGVSSLQLKVAVVNNTSATFMYSRDGRRFQVLNKTAVDAAFLPPWDRAVRVGLVSKGDPQQYALFKNFFLNVAPEKKKL